MGVGVRILRRTVGLNGGSSSHTHAAVEPTAGCVVAANGRSEWRDENSLTNADHGTVTSPPAGLMP